MKNLDAFLTAFAETLLTLTDADVYTIAELCVETGSKKRTTERAVAWLKEKGYVITSRGGQARGGIWLDENQLRTHVKVPRRNKPTIKD